MQRVKLTFVGLAALMGVMVLSGCQGDPDRAASISGTSIDNADVDAIVATVQEDVKKTDRELPPDALGDVRRTVVEFTVFNELARRYAQEKKISVGPADYQAAAQQIGLPAEDPYVRLYAEASVLRTALVAQATPATPTEADYRETYDRLVSLSSGEVQPYEQIKPLLAKEPGFAEGLGLRKELLAAAERYGLVVNPRYAPMSVPLTSTSDGSFPLVTLPLGEQGTGAVRDLPVPAPSAG